MNQATQRTPQEAPQEELQLQPQPPLEHYVIPAALPLPQQPEQTVILAQTSHINRAILRLVLLGVHVTIFMLRPTIELLARALGVTLNAPRRAGPGRQPRLANARGRRACLVANAPRAVRVAAPDRTVPLPIPEEDKRPEGTMQLILAASQVDGRMRKEETPDVEAVEDGQETGRDQPEEPGTEQRR